MTRQELRDALARNNEAYRRELITRSEWVANNRELAREGEQYGMTLPAFAVTDDSP